MLPVRFLAFVIGAAAVAGCSEKRAASSATTWDAEVSQIMAAKCTQCHGAHAPGWRATSYLDAIACTQAGPPAVLPPDDGAPMLRALADATHAGVASADERDAIARWVSSGVPKLARGVHDPSFMDPRSPAFHGAALRAKQWKPMTAANDAEAC